MPFIRVDDDEAGQAYVDNQNEPGKYHFGDGLYLIVKPSGAKSYMLRYPQRREGKLIYAEMGLGSVRDTTFAKVRESARYFLEQSAQGNNPRQKREQKQSEQTVHSRHKAERIVQASLSEEDAETILLVRVRLRNASSFLASDLVGLAHAAIPR